MKYWLTSFLWLLVLSGAFAQNLVPNGSFESTTNLVYLSPPEAFPFLDFWYPANDHPEIPNDSGTPDLFDIDHPWPETSPPNFWNIAYGAAAGLRHVGIANHLLNQGFRLPEALGTPLTQSLEAGAYYHIQLRARNKGVATYQNIQEPMFCIAEPHKQIQILLDADPVFVTIDRNNRDSYVEAAKIIDLQSPELEEQQAGAWHRLGTCFEANGGEKNLTIAMTAGRFAVYPPCVIDTSSIDAFYLYYYDLDDIQLTRLPTAFYFSESICAGEPNVFDVAELTGLPIMQNEITYHWPDGQITTQNTITEAGTYVVEAITDCLSIPITLDITDADCEPAVFVPNAFSPNQDGVNDELETFLSAELPLLSYQFEVYNRWGALVFSSKDVAQRWDGTFQQKTAPAGVYLWSLSYTLEDLVRGPVVYREQGDVLLLR